jgi:hypothetical protein
VRGERTLNGLGMARAAQSRAIAAWRLRDDAGSWTLSPRTIGELGYHTRFMSPAHASVQVAPASRH